ncbi:N-acyl-D-amino-acid deacylase [Kitasatospora phosalacinea]|uniref:N-acyl-D-amino-acid deacylase n=1 Tax=Kitasatospora phosalacinea TaxID=2065 RepID=A0A9W6V5P2_9ACTN|nr:D-aminoacylase [Kitasatospora phosalacinea]GLW73427.1 N-acyl-D-amino-acid deacylase [Kitasatospora phosalacinea]
MSRHDPSPLPYDLVVRGAEVLDGTGAPAVRADVAVRSGRIAGVGDLVGRARREVDARGLVLAPGLVDLHSHADLTLAGAPQAEGCLRQGVTTVVTGNCGMSPFPVDPAAGPGVLPGPGPDAPPPVDLDAFAAAVTAARPAVNLAAQVGHGTLRAAVLGSALRRASADELAAMCELLGRAARQGAFGFSTGLIYAPGSFADAAEVRALAAEAHRHGLLYSTHLRDEGDALLPALTEALDTARATGVRLQVSHLKAMGPANHGKVHEALALIDAARAAGVDVATDVYPYAASSTRLSSRLPGWALDGGTPELLARLADPVQRERIGRELAVKEGRTFLPEGTVLAAMAPGPYDRYTGATLREVALAEGVGGAEAALRVLAGHGEVLIVNHAMAEADVAAVLAGPHTAVASDGWELDASCGGHPHPRHFGTFARVLGAAARGEGPLTLPQAVHRMTGLPADRIGLADRGRVAVGRVADLMAFDPRTVTDRATYEHPLRYAAGVAHVLVAGEPVLLDGELTGARPGAVLRRARPSA